MRWRQPADTRHASPPHFDGHDADPGFRTVYLSFCRAAERQNDIHEEVKNYATGSSEPGEEQTTTTIA